MQQLAREVIGGKNISFDEALKLIKTGDDDTINLLAAAQEIVRHFKGKKVKLCSIINAKSGRCSENCSFCAQSAHHQTSCQVYPLMSDKEMLSAAQTAEKQMGSTCFSLVTSGKTVHTDQELITIGRTLAGIAQTTKMNRCVSLGTLSQSQIEQLKAAGLTRIHHNLETAESFFPKMCTTHSYAERVATIKAAKAAGVSVCSGGIFSLGESLEQRVELALALRALEVVSVPINILNPVAGTPAGKHHPPITPWEVLRLIATYRFVLPRQDIGVFGGREKALGTLQPLMFTAGANVTLVGNYLTTRGQAAEQDQQMIRDLGLEIDARVH